MLLRYLFTGDNKEKINEYEKLITESGEQWSCHNEWNAQVPPILMLHTA